MPQIKTITTDEINGIKVTDECDNLAALTEFKGRQVKRATKVGSRIVVHLVGAAPGKLLVFGTASDYEKVVRRQFVPSSRTLPNRE